MKLGIKVSTIVVLLGILLLSTTYVLADDKATKDPTDYVSDLETTGVTGSNNAIVITDDDIDENVEKLIDAQDDQKKEETEPSK